MTQFNYLKNVVTLKYDSSKCIGCGMCVTVCPHRVFKLDKKKASITNIDKCMECGACELNCITGAISVKKGVGCAAAVLNSYFNNGVVSCSCDSN
ncbi:MAG: mercury methylation ferredoxin HgcB [Prolixibacteraceae bacterium]|jgi:ferredoxin|nr:mercury methylation ferredoxin HgcB [Prolixibacteraceae bacterium]